MKNVRAIRWTVRNKTANHYETVSSTIKGGSFGIASANTYRNGVVLNERDWAAPAPRARAPQTSPTASPYLRYRLKYLIHAWEQLQHDSLSNSWIGFICYHFIYVLLMKAIIWIYSEWFSRISCPLVRTFKFVFAFPDLLIHLMVSVW